MRGSSAQERCGLAPGGRFSWSPAPCTRRPLQRFALIFTVLVFAAVLGGLLSRHGGAPVPSPRTLQPKSTPIFAPLVDPLGVGRDPSLPRADRLELRVVDPAGLAVSGAALVVRAGNKPLWAFTDAYGRAVLEGLAPGKSRMAVIALPHPGLELDIVPGPGELEVRLAAAIEPQPLLAEIPRSRLAGRLSGAPPEALAECEVLLLPVAAPNELGGAMPRRCSADAQGSFAFDSLAHAVYQVCVLPAWASGGSWPDLAAAADRTLDFKAARNDLSIALARGEIEGEVRDDLGRALEGALVWATDAGNELRIWPPAASGPDGRFRIADLPPGKYRVSCRAGEGGSTLEELVVAAGASAWAAMPGFAARKRPQAR